MIICYTVPEIWYMDVIVIIHIGLFFALLPPTTARKNEKKAWRYHHFTQVHQKS